MNFNENQIKAVSHKKGPAMVLAGPGSGKTTVITHRIKNLIESGVPPEKILVVTFTKAAAIHMQKKFFHIMQGENWIRGSYPVSFGTFHSIFFRILKHTKNYGGEKILGENVKFQILREIVLRKKIEASNMNDFIHNLASEISKIKSKMTDINSFESQCCNKEISQGVFEEYQRVLSYEHKIDFDDMLLKCYELFQEQPKILEKWQQIFEYILIDEFQDINYVQYEIIKMLAFPQNNIFVVGDDDQSIYGFRGACPELMFQFEKDFVGYEKIMLNRNYRSSEKIVKISERLICNNSNRFIKNMRSDFVGDVEPEIKLFKTQYEELEYIVQKIKKLKCVWIAESEIAILVRNNSQIPEIQKFLYNREIIANGRESKKFIYESVVAKDIIAYVKASLSYQNTNFRNNQDLIYVLNKPVRYISRHILAQENMNFHKLKEMYGQSMEIKKNIEKLEFDLQMLSNLKPMAAVLYIEKGIGYEKYLRDYAKEKHISISVLRKQLEEIKNDCCRYHTLDDWINSIEETDEENVESDNIKIMTMHSAKGLEFDAVFIVDVNQGIIPTSKAVRNRDYEEERRVFYVAVTRAKKILGVYAVTENLGCRVEPSMFLNEVINIL
ncbi:MAG: ATP-dependent helicase [Eubacterium sp.]|nr:ATP-dependent helicase [Eubacterium sp.]